MPKPSKKLTALAIERLRERGRYRDSRGLYLQVVPLPSGHVSRSWVFRYMLAARPRHVGLGKFPEVSLATARKLAEEWRAKLKGPDPVDPLTERRRKLDQMRQAHERTFGKVAEDWLKTREKKWTSEKYRAGVERLLREDCKTLWTKPVAEVTEDGVRLALAPVWERAPVTAARLRMYMEGVLARAKARKWRTGENPARWRENLEHEFVAHSRRRDAKPHAALPFDQAPAFAAELRKQGDVAAKALEFLLLTAVRAGNVRLMRWSEVSLPKAEWTIPRAEPGNNGEEVNRTKTGEQFRVPLSPRAVAILQELPRVSEFVFPGEDGGKPFGGTTLHRLIKKLRPDVTVHGLRSTFRDWTAERTNFPNVVAEMGLQHEIPSAVEASYRRGELLDRRRKLMDAWAKYLASPPATGATVTSINTKERVAM